MTLMRRPAQRVKQPLVALLGRDLLQKFVLIYNGPMGTLTLGH